MTQVQLSLRDLSRLVVLQTQSGKSRDEVVQVLVARGWPEVSAVRFVDMTLFEQGGRSAGAGASEEEQGPTRRAFSAGPGSWKALLVPVLIMAVLMALLIAGVLSVLTR
jgi:hypothetical protein